MNKPAGSRSKTRLFVHLECLICVVGVLRSTAGGGPHETNEQGFGSAWNGNPGGGGAGFGNAGACSKSDGRGHRRFGGVSGRSAQQCRGGSASVPGKPASGRPGGGQYTPV